MLKSKKNLLLLTTMLCAFNANAQFFDLNDDLNDIEAEQQLNSIAYDDEESKIDDDLNTLTLQEQDLELNQQQATQIPDVEGFSAFTQNVVIEEDIKEQVRNIKQLDFIGVSNKFDEALWIGTDYDYAAKQFSKLSENQVKSEHIKNILRDMLMAKARAPQSDKSWLVLRLKTLLSMGYLQDVATLLKDVKPQELVLLENHELNNIYLQANLFNDKFEVSKFIKEILIQDPQNLTYKKALLIDLINNGKSTQAKLSFDALVELNPQVRETNFAKLIATVLDKQTLDLSTLTNDLDIFDQYTIALNKELFTNINYTKISDKVLYVMSEKANSLDEKLEILEQLLNKSPQSFPVTLLTNAYDSYEFSSKELSVPLKYTKESENEFASRALLYQASKINGLNSTKAIALKQLWIRYDENKLANLKTLIDYKSQGLNLDRSIAWFSADLLKSELLKANVDVPAIKVMYENIDNSYTQLKVLNLQIALEFLRKTTLISSDVDSIQDYKETLQQWFDSNKIDSKENYNYVLKVLTMLDALDNHIPVEMWNKLYQHSNLESKSDSNPIWLRLVTSAIQKGEKGKALLLISDLFTQNDELSLDPQTLANIIACLNYLNMPQDMALVGVKAIVN